MINLLPFLAIIGYGFADYVGFNRVSPLTVYRIFQGIGTVLIYLFLLAFGGFIPTLIFFILHFTFWCDLVYYFLYDTLKWYGGNYAGTAYKNEVLGDKVTWAWWTFYGLFTRSFRGLKSTPIAGSDLIGQAAAGLVLSILIALFL